MKKTELTDQQIARLCSSFSLMLHAGMTPADSAFLLAEEEDRTVQKLLTGLGKALDRGTSLSEAMEKQGLFPQSVTGMVRIGECTGKMEEALRALSAFYEERHRVNRLLRNAVAYPSLILTLMLLVVGVLLTQVLPVFERVYASLGSRLTGVAAGLLDLGELLQAALPGLLAVLILGVLAVLLFACLPGVRRWAVGLWKRAFSDRGASRKFNNARFARSLSMGLSSGLTMEETMTLAGQLLSDAPGAARRCDNCARMLASGAALPEAMEKCDLLPAAAARMLAVGLRAGNGEQVMEEIANRLMEDAVQSLEESISRVEPAMVLVSSLLVGAILLSVMLPLMHIMTAIG